MSDPAPTVYYLYGDDEFAMFEFVHQMKQKLGDATTTAMNFEVFNASALDWSNLEAVAQSFPFLASRRLVVLDHAERLTKEQDGLDRLFTLMESLPHSTAFVLLERTSNGSKKKSSSKIHDWLQAKPSFSYIRACQTPRGNAFVHWLQQRASAMKGTINKDAAELLAEWIQEDPRFAQQELSKLLDYVDRQRAITVEDVEQCTPYRGQADIFALVDAIGNRHGEEALHKLHSVFEESDPTYAFAMILRQFRLILKARDLIDSGETPDKRIHHSNYVVNKVSAQARNFSLSDIEQIYRELLSIDLAVKNGQIALDTALDRLVAAVTT
jgi:DNA polymerase-3 subunit delta